MNSNNYKKAGFVLLVIVLTLSISCEKIEEMSYLDQWLGMYEGSSFHWSQEFDSSKDSVVRMEYIQTVLAEVRRGKIDSSLSITLTFDDKFIHTQSDLIFSDSGYYFSAWGRGGSSYSQLMIRFRADSMHYSSYGKAGIASSGGTYFSIAKRQ